jgi:hypothetical protein
MDQPSTHPTGFTGWTHVGPDAKVVVTHGEGGVEDVKVTFPTPASMFAVPDIYLNRDIARQLRDDLIVTLHEIDRAEAHAASLAFGGDFIADAYVRGES